MTTPLLSGLDDDQRTCLDVLATHDPEFRRAEATRLCRRALVSLCWQAAASSMANPEKLAVIHELSQPDPATFYLPTSEAIAERRRALARFSWVGGWTTEAQRFFALADDALADIDKASLMELGDVPELAAVERAVGEPEPQRRAS